MGSAKAAEMLEGLEGMTHEEQLAEIERRASNLFGIIQDFLAHQAPDDEGVACAASCLVALGKVVEAG